MAKSKGRRLAEWLRNLDSNSKATKDTIANSSIDSTKLEDDAVTNPKIADGAVHTANIADTGVTFAKLHTALVVTESDAIGNNDNDTTIATSAAIKDYVDTAVAGKDNTDEITEGSTNLYFTNERVDDRVASLLTAGTGITLTYNDTANTLTVAGAAQYGDSDVGSYLSTNGYATQSTIVAAITDSAPATLDTLNELAAALGDDANFSTTTATSLGNRLRVDTAAQGLTSTQQGNARTNLGLGTAATTASTDYVSRTFLNTNNLVINGTSTANQAGLLMRDSESAMMFQIYGTGTQFGFLDAAWGNWDLKKTSGGNLEIDINGTLQTVYHTGNLPTIPTNNNQLTNGAGYITSFDITTQTDSKYLRSDTTDTATGVITFDGGSTSSFGPIITSSSTGGPALKIKSTATNGNDWWIISNNSSNADGAGRLQLWNNTGAFTAATIGHSASVPTNFYTDFQVAGDIQSKSQIRAQGWWNTATGNYGDTAVEIGMSAGTGYILCYNRNTSSYGNLVIQPASINLNPVSGGAVNIKGYTAWHAGNDGSGSGLDADTVDGIQGANFLRSDTSDTMSGTLTITNPTYGGISIGETATNYAGWNTQLNSHGAGHSRLNIKTANVQMGVYAHDSWHGGAMGHVGTYTNHQLSFLCNSNQRAVLTTGGSFSTTVQGTVWGASNDGSGSGLDADNLDGYTWGTAGKNVFAENFDINSANGNALRFWGGSTSYQIAMSAQGTSGYGRMAYETTSDYNMYFRMSGTNLNRGFVFQDSTNNRVGIDQSGNVRAQGVISSNNKQAMNCAHWSAAGNTTGAIKITLPGTYNGNYSMPVIEITTYRYSGDAGVIYRVSGHNWNNGVWYYTGVTSEGGTPLAVRLGHDGTNDCIIIGETTTVWPYGSVTVSLLNHPSIYASAQNFTSGWGIGVITSMPGTVTAQTVRKLWHTSNDGSGSGLDADLLDGYNSTNYVNKNGTSYYQFNTWLQGTSGHGLYFPSSGTGTHFYPGGVGDYGSFSCEGRKGGWGGYSIEGRAVFMHDGSSGTGIYNDVNNQWLFYATHGAETRMYHNGSQHIYTYASGGRVTGNWLATGDVYAYYSDERLKIKTGKLENAIEKVKEIETFYYTHNEKAIELGYEGTEQQIGVSAQSVEKVLPEVVHLAPIDDDGEGNSVSGEEYKTVNYGRLVPLLIEAIKEQQAQIEELKEKLKCQ